MLVLVLGLIASIIPSAILYFYLRNLRKDDKEYYKNCRKLLVAGLLCSFGVFLLDLLLNIGWSMLHIAEDIPIVKVLFRCFIVNAFAEELVKYLNARRVIRKNKVSWLDCIAYCAIVGIGFHIIESIVLVLSSNLMQILVKGITMGHPAYGMFMGYCVGKAYDEKKSYGIMGFLFLILLHGFYNFSLSDEFMALNENLIFVPFLLVGVDLLLLISVFLFVKKHRNDPKYTEPFDKTEVVQTEE